MLSRAIFCVSARMESVMLMFTTLNAACRRSECGPRLYRISLSAGGRLSRLEDRDRDQRAGGSVNPWQQGLLTSCATIPCEQRRVFMSGSNAIELVGVRVEARQRRTGSKTRQNTRPSAVAGAGHGVRLRPATRPTGSSVFFGVWTLAAAASYGPQLFIGQPDARLRRSQSDPWIML